MSFWQAFNSWELLLAVVSEVVAAQLFPLMEVGFYTSILLSALVGSLVLATLLLASNRQKENALSITSAWIVMWAVLNAAVFVHYRYHLKRLEKLLWEMSGSKAKARRAARVLF